MQRVLFVTQEADITGILGQTFSFNPAFATSGNEGLKALSEAPVDAIVFEDSITDTAISDFLQKAGSLSPGVRVVILIKPAGMSGVSRVLRHPLVFRVLNRPVQTAALIRAIHDALQADPTPAPPPASDIPPTPRPEAESEVRLGETEESWDDFVKKLREEE